jgi:hypothetical protein
VLVFNWLGGVSVWLSVGCGCFLWTQVTAPITETVAYLDEKKRQVRWRCLNQNFLAP